MKINENTSLKDLNTFGINSTAKYLAEIHNLDDIEALLEWKAQNNLPTLLLGGGSNLLFRNDFDGLVAKICLAGKDIAEEDDNFTTVSVAGGENWHDFVRWTVEQGLAGLENLSLIPGTVGAAPIQNIGAYGVELADHFQSLQAIDLDSGNIHEFDKSHCQFGYRESFFKSQTLDKLLITSVTFALPKKPKWKMDYAGVREALAGIEPTAELISDTIIALRQSKLPDPAQIGNAGSFFKNPVLNQEAWGALKNNHSNIPGYVQADGSMKTSAAWLIDQCGWKGYRKGDAGVSDMHALVLVNHAQATGSELWSVAQEIIKSVEDKFGISLEPEPRVVK
jgi:UDP-N-acetylmuramate dehydrogenase